MGHLFADIWSRPGLAVRDRRLLVMGIVVMMGRAEIMDTKVYGALVNEELTLEELDEVALQLHFYAGWSKGSTARIGIDRAVAQHQGEA